jgi:hypothetical protein
MVTRFCHCTIDTMFVRPARCESLPFEAKHLWETSETWQRFCCSTGERCDSQQMQVLRREMPCCGTRFAAAKNTIKRPCVLSYAGAYGRLHSSPASAVTHLPRAHMPLCRLTAHAFQDWMPRCSIYFIGILAHVALSIGRWRRTAARAAAMTGNRARKRDHCWPAEQSLVWLISSIAARETPRHTSSARHPASHRVADSR